MRVSDLSLGTVGNGKYGTQFFLFVWPNRRNPCIEILAYSEYWHCFLRPHFYRLSVFLCFLLVFDNVRNGEGNKNDINLI